jgi:hypothetical protein
VRNAADVLVPLGADELDYTLTAAGNLLGTYADTDPALGGGNMRLVAFDTTCAKLCVTCALEIEYRFVKDKRRQSLILKVGRHMTAAERLVLLPAGPPPLLPPFRD